MTSEMSRRLPELLRQFQNRAIDSFEFMVAGIPQMLDNSLSNPRFPKPVWRLLL